MSPTLPKADIAGAPLDRLPLVTSEQVYCHLLGVHGRLLWLYILCFIGHNL